MAVVDSGVEADHPDLEGCVDVAGGVRIELDEGGQPVEVAGPHGDDFGHGTAVSGIIHSLAPEARITSVKVLGAGLTGPSPTSCWAVGSSSQTAAGANGSSSLIEQWVGSAWAVVGSPSAPGSSPQASLAGVACPSPGFCWAVGSSGSTTLVEGWDGSSWSTTASPNVGFVNALSGVACPSAGQCYAVGSFTPTSSTNAYALIEEWNGSSWSVLYPGSRAPTQGDLAGAGCASINRCWAVGSAAGSGTMLLAITSQAPASAISLTRIAGQSRDLTSVAASQSAFPAAGSARAVVLASDADFPDALAGTPLAVAKAGPLLLTTPTSLDAAVGSEISRVLPRGDAVYVLGGDAALSASVSQSVAAMGYQIVRLAGSDRYGTALAVAGALGDPSTVLLATGLDFPDGLSAGAAAAEVGGAVLLTDGASQAPGTASYLSAHPAAVTAVGGPACQADTSARCVAGATRYDTSVDVAQAFFTSPADLGFASGVAFPDALSGGAHIGHLGGPMVLVPASGPLPQSTYAYIQAQAQATAGYLYGGTGAVSDEVAAEIG